MYSLGSFRSTLRCLLIEVVVLPCCDGWLRRARRLNVEVKFRDLDDVMLFCDIDLVGLQIIRA